METINGVPIDPETGLREDEIALIIRVALDRWRSIPEPPSDCETAFIIGFFDAARAGFATHNQEMAALLDFHDENSRNSQEDE